MADDFILESNDGPQMILGGTPVEDFVIEEKDSDDFIIDGGEQGKPGLQGPTGPTGPTGPAGTDSNPYTNSNPVPVTIGGVAAGTTFSSETMTEVFNQLFYPYQLPAFSAFNFTGETTPLEVGDSIASNRTFNWATTNSSNVVANSISLLDVTGSATIASGLANTGSYASTYAAITKIVAAVNQFKVQGNNTQSGTFSATSTVSWQWKIYFGESASSGINAAGVTGLRVNGLQGGFAGTYSFVGGGYKYIAYPASMGTATTFKDTSTNLSVPMNVPYTVSITNAFSITTTYNVHQTVNILGGAINIAVS